MFDRCDANSRAVLDAALTESRRLGHNYLGTEHLLVALVDRRHLLPEIAAALLPDPDSVRSALAAALGASPQRDAELLEVMGIDLDEVRSAVRHTFGADALERLGRRRAHQPWQPWRRPSRRCSSLLAGTMSVAPRVKQSLERARHDAERRGITYIDPAALLLGTVEVPDAMSNRLLRDTGADPERIRRARRGLDPWDRGANFGAN